MCTTQSPTRNQLNEQEQSEDLRHSEMEMENWGSNTLRTEPTALP